MMMMAGRDGGFSLYTWSVVGVRLTSLVVVVFVCLGFWALQIGEDYHYITEQLQDHDGGSSFTKRKHDDDDDGQDNNFVQHFGMHGTSSIIESRSSSSYSVKELLELRKPPPPPPVVKVPVTTATTQSPNNVPLLDLSSSSPPSDPSNNNNNDNICNEENNLDHLLTDYAALSKHIQKQRSIMEEAAKVNYSHYYRDLFYVNATTTTTPSSSRSRGKLALFNPNQPQGWNTLKSRLKTKILKVQERLLLLSSSAGKEQQQQQHPCIVPSSSTTKSSAAAAAAAAATEPDPVKWIHAVAGHSSAAGHGNFVHQSYGAVMNDVLTPIFESIGIETEFRNTGMSAKQSAPEMALCQEAVLGVDVDLVVWDYGETDLRDTQFVEYYMQRASMMQSHPILIGKEDLDSTRYKNTMDNLYQQHPNLPLLIVNQTQIKQMEQAVPDSVPHKFKDLPPLLNYLKCDDMLEATSLCGSNKFQIDVCQDRYWKTNWHPGYKRLALWGNLFALFVLDALQEAIQELQHEMILKQVSQGRRIIALPSIQKRLEELEMEHREQIRQIQSANYQPSLTRPGKPGKPLSAIFPGINTTWFYQSKILCRTMRLPSQQRYKGISTGHPVRYDGLVPLEGMEHEAIYKSFGKGGNSSSKGALELQLGYDEMVRYSQRQCNKFTTNFDFSDYMYVTDTWRKTLLPSPAEVKEYFSSQSQLQPEFHGIVMVCLLDCNKQTKACYGDEFNWKKHKPFLEFEVNEIPVIDLIPFINRGCVVLKHHGGFIFPALQQQQDDDNKHNKSYYDLRVRIRPNNVGGGRVLQLTSIILI